MLFNFNFYIRDIFILKPNLNSFLKIKTENTICFIIMNHCNKAYLWFTRKYKPYYHLSIHNKEYCKHYTELSGIYNNEFIYSRSRYPYMAVWAAIKRNNLVFLNKHLKNINREYYEGYYNILHQAVLFAIYNDYYHLVNYIINYMQTIDIEFNKKICSDVCRRINMKKGLYFCL